MAVEARFESPGVLAEGAGGGIGTAVRLRRRGRGAPGVVGSVLRIAPHGGSVVWIAPHGGDLPSGQREPRRLWRGTQRAQVPQLRAARAGGEQQHG